MIVDAKTYGERMGRWFVRRDAMLRKFSPDYSGDLDYEFNALVVEYAELAAEPLRQQLDRVMDSLAANYTFGQVRIDPMAKKT